MKIEQDQLYSVSGGSKLSTATRTEFQAHFCHSSMLLQWKQGRIQKVNETRSDQNPVHKVSL